MHSYVHAFVCDEILFEDDDHNVMVWINMVLILLNDNMICSPCFYLDGMLLPWMI